MNDDLKKILDESYNNNNSNNNNNFVDPNDVLNVNTINNVPQNVITPTVNSNISNNSNVSEEPAKKKKKMISLPVLIFIIIGAIAIIFIIISDIKDSKDKVIPKINQGDKKTTINNEENSQSSDIYGYSILSYIPDDNSWKEYYRIVELHIKENDKTLASYDGNVKNAINQIRNINVNSAKIVNNKLYYQLYYNSSNNGITTYNNIMCIDLTSDDKIPYAVFEWKQDEINSAKAIKGFKVTYSYIYFSTNDPALFYKYNFNSNEIEESNEGEFNKIKEKTDNKYTRLSTPMNYYREKEIYVEDNNKIIYNGETLYSAPNSILSLYYSFSDNIVFSEGTDCVNISCDTIKYYTYDFTSNSKHEIDFNNNQIFSQVIWHK